MRSEVKLSDRGHQVPASPIRKLAPFADEARASGAQVYHLNIGQPDIETPPEMLEVYRSYRDPVLAYGPSAGIPDFRKAVADYWKAWQVELSPEEVITTTGGSEAILFALLATCDAGDEVLVPEPFYTNYLGFASAASVKIVAVPANVEDGFRLPSPGEFRKRINDRTRAILFSNPGNPTGVVYSRDEMQTLADLASEEGLYLLADEVYREFVYDGAPFTSAFHLEGVEDRVIMLDSVSKRFSACGARVGYLATHNEEILDSALRFGQARLCPPTLDQMASAAAFQAKGDYLDRVLGEYSRRRDCLYEGLRAIPGIMAHRPEGAFYTVARLPLKDAEHFATWLLSDFRYKGSTLMVAPAAGFYASEGLGLDEIRIAYVLKEKDLRLALEALAEALKVYSP